MQQPLPFFHNSEAIPESIDEQPPLQVAGLFAGIGGIELGLHTAGHETRLVCEIEPCATAALKQHMASVPHHADVTTLERLPDVDLLTAGFPCQDLSIAGRRAGIGGSRSSLVEHVFRLLDTAPNPPTWLLLENVPFMLRLQNGEGMRYLVSELESRGFRWAYRVFDTRAFGIPHRRQRVLLLASRTLDPRHVLLSDDVGVGPKPERSGRVFGFYWTEGNRGIGWSEESVPPIKVGSGLGIPSAPAVWDSATGSIITIDIRDAERLQGFPIDWTLPAESVGKQGDRWRLIGNSVSVPLGAWVGGKFRQPKPYAHQNDWPLSEGVAWPDAAWGENGKRYESKTSMWPTSAVTPSLSEFLEFPGRRLSSRAAAGLLKRIRNGSTAAPDKFMTTLEGMARQEEVRLAHVRCQKLEEEIGGLKRAIQGETQFSRQVELNHEVRSLEKRLTLARLELETSQEARN